VQKKPEGVSYQVQRWVPGKGIGIEILARQGDVIMHFAHERVHEVPLTGGGSSYRKSIPVPSAPLVAAKKLIAACGWHGVAMVEFRSNSDSGQFWLMEINGRFWGSLPLACHAGADFAKALVDLLLYDREPTFQTRTDVYARNLTREIIWIKQIVKARHRNDPQLLKRPLGQALWEWTRVLNGKDTWDGAHRDDLGPLIYEIGNCAAQEAQTVLRKVRRAALLRLAGAIASSARESVSGKHRILVLCQGNICRSPYVHQRLAAHRFDKKLDVRSAGFHPKENRTSPPLIQALAAKRSVDLALHRSRRLTADDIAWAELILIMDQRNFDNLAVFDRTCLDRVIWLGSFARHDGGEAFPLEIEDPYDLNPDEAEAVFQRLDRAVSQLLDEL
jgi:protein-tyrosine-phosphatase